MCLKRFLWRGAALLLLLTGAGGWGWRTAPTASPAHSAQVTMTAQPELGAVAPDIDDLRVSVNHDLAATEWGRQTQPIDNGWSTDPPTDQPPRHDPVVLHKLALYGDQAVVGIVTNSTNGAPVYRQTRFYRRSSASWLPVEPDAALWGAKRSLATPSFLYHLREGDAPAVIAVAPEVEALYTTLRQNFGLPTDPGTEKLVIDVSVNHPPEQGQAWSGAPDQIMVASSALYWAPAELTDAELLAQFIALPLLEMVLAEASERHLLGAFRRPLLNGLRLWQVWDLNLPLALWREDTVTWLYGNLYVAGSRQPPVLPERYTGLRAAHKLWMATPFLINIPLSCTKADSDYRYFSLWRRTLPGPQFPNFYGLTFLPNPLTMVKRVQRRWVRPCIAVFPFDQQRSVPHACSSTNTARNGGEPSSEHHRTSCGLLPGEWLSGHRKCTHYRGSASATPGNRADLPRRTGKGAWPAPRPPRRWPMG